MADASTGDWNGGSCSGILIDVKTAQDPTPFRQIRTAYSHLLLQKPQLIGGGKKFCEFLREQCPVVSETYYPTFWCWESRVQTLLRPFVTAKPWVTYRKWVIIPFFCVAVAPVLRHTCIGGMRHFCMTSRAITSGTLCHLLSVSVAVPTGAEPPPAKQ